jgi:hypothetical protein
VIGECLVDLRLAVHKAAELHGALAGLNLQIEALDGGVGQQRRLDAGGDDRVVDHGAHGDGR